MISSFPVMQPKNAPGKLSEDDRSAILRNNDPPPYLLINYNCPRTSRNLNYSTAGVTFVNLAANFQFEFKKALPIKRLSEHRLH